MPWLLKKETSDELVALRKELMPYAAANNPRVAYDEAKQSGKIVTGPDAVMKVAEGGVAEIRVEGVLTPEPDACAWMFGIKNTAYSDIVGALSKAGADTNIKSVLFLVDSPGGNVDGLFETLAAIQAFGKPMSVLANQACSAAYAIAAVAGKIRATNPAASFGSIGVAASLRLDADSISITSTEAPDKRPDVTTDEGRAVVVKHLDDIHDLFAGAIADGRGIEASKVNATFGRGATLLAKEAKSLGMIDSVNEPPRLKRINGRAAAADENQAINAADGEESEMALDMKTLKAQHPELVAQIEQETLTAERDRVGAHIVAGEASGDMKTALAAIKDGSLMTQTMMTQHMMAGMNRNDRSARQSESDAAGKVVDGATPPAVVNATADVGDAAAALMAERRGKKLVAANG